MVDAGRTRSMPSRAVLYVDPDETARRRLSRDLAAGADDSAIEVEGVATAAALRDALAEESSAYACVVTEYRLADTDALALYDSLRADGLATVPFVLYTDGGSEALASEAITAGFSGYVPKGRVDSLERLRRQLRAIVENGAPPSERYRHDLERYRTLVETVGDAMYVLDSNGRFEMVNDALTDYFGVAREKLVGAHATEFAAEEDVERLRSLLAEIRASDDRTHGCLESTVELPDGTIRHVEDNVAPLLDDNGELVGSIGAIRDVTGRKERERRLRLLHDGTRRLMGAKNTEEIASVVTEIAVEALDLSITGVYLYEENVLTRSAADTGTGSSGGPSVNDRTDREATESASEESGALVPTAMSDRALELFRSVRHFEPGDGVAWDAYEAGEAMVHGDVRQAPNVRNPETPIRSEAHVPLGDHGIFIVSSLEPNDFDPETLTLVRILAANAEAALDRAEREEELADRGRKLERQNERLEAFASTVSHDLRNPVTLAMGHLELLEDRIDGAADDHCAEIEWALKRMDELIENVLTLARSGRRLTETEPVDLAAVVERAERTVEGDLEVVRDGSLPTVDGDEERLCVLFENVFRNAIEHGSTSPPSQAQEDAVEHGSTSPDSHARRDAVKRRSANPGSMENQGDADEETTNRGERAGATATVTIEPTFEGFAIADDGPGIPPGERDRVLEWGYSTDAEGTGFGLAIVAEVVEAHGWSVAVGESDAGGLRLAVSIPP